MDRKFVEAYLSSKLSDGKKIDKTLDGLLLFAYTYDLFIDFLTNYNKENKNEK